MEMKIGGYYKRNVVNGTYRVKVQSLGGPADVTIFQAEAVFVPLGSDDIKLSFDSFRLEDGWEPIAKEEFDTYRQIWTDFYSA